MSKPAIHEVRYFSRYPAHRAAALRLYKSVQDLPLVCPHGHVDPRIFVDPQFKFGSPTELILIPDHYIFRMLYSQGISLEALAIPRKDNGAVEVDHRKAWQLFADNFYLFRGTPTGIWLTDELRNVFGIEEKLKGDNAQEIYDHIDTRLNSADFSPRALFEQFNIEVLSTTDAATDTLEYHGQIQGSDWDGRVLPAFRPDAVVNIDTPEWLNNIQLLEDVTSMSITSYQSFIAALEDRRTFFKSMGATATDQAVRTAFTLELSETKANKIFQSALFGRATQEEAADFSAHMIVEMARMSTEDGLVMQLHIGSHRDHNPRIFNDFGADKGADIPLSSEFTLNLKHLLDKFGNDPRLILILFNLDESTYARELAPLAGHYPALKLGPPWWFHDSFNGIRRFLDSVIETAGIYNTVGFNDDTRAFLSIPARHNLWRRACCDWLAGLMLRQIIDEHDAHEMARALAYDLAKKAYKL